MSGGKRSAVALGLVCLGLGVGVGTAHAAPTEVVAADECCEFLDRPYEQPRGEVARFVNPETADAIHNVYSTEFGPDRGPLFLSGTISPGDESPIRGTQYLNAGRYPFFCTVHPATMTGELQVTDSGTAARRPSIRLAIPAQRLSTLVKKGTVRLTVSSPTGIRRGSLKVRVGQARIRPAILDELPAGATRVTFTIPAKVRKSLRGKRSVTVVGEAAVPFGLPANARRVIR